MAVSVLGSHGKGQSNLGTQDIPGSFGYGDVSGNGDVSSYDARLIQQIAVGDKEASGKTLVQADVDGDGVVTKGDAEMVLEYAVGNRSSFPAQSQPQQDPSEIQIQANVENGSGEDDSSEDGSSEDDSSDENSNGTGEGVQASTALLVVGAAGALGFYLSS